MVDPLEPPVASDVPQRPDVDQPLEPLVAVALERVLRDLRATGGPSPRVADERWGHAELQATATLRGASAAGGVSVTRGDEPAQQVVSAADGVQEWAIDELRRLGLPTNWPVCPMHLATHPLQPELRAGAPTWCCPLTGAPVAPIGGLGRRAAI